MSVTELVDSYRDEGYSDEEIDLMVQRDLQEAKADFIDQYENDPIVQDGWAQQDLIDMYRYER
ncbi:MAG: hypothetical protein RSC06_00660 [Clostridia bacterium]